MSRHIIALLICASAATADYVVDWRVPQDNDANANAWVAAVVVPVGEKVVLEGPCQASSTWRVLKRFAADEHTYVEVVDTAGGSPKSVITQSRRTGPMFSGISCRPCK